MSRDIERIALLVDALLGPDACRPSGAVARALAAVTQTLRAHARWRGIDERVDRVIAQTRARADCSYADPWVTASAHALVGLMIGAPSPEDLAKTVAPAARRAYEMELRRLDALVESAVKEAVRCYTAPDASGVVPVVSTDLAAKLGAES